MSENEARNGAEGTDQHSSKVSRGIRQGEGQIEQVGSCGLHLGIIIRQTCTTILPCLGLLHEKDLPCLELLFPDISQQCHCRTDIQLTVDLYAVWML